MAKFRWVDRLLLITGLLLVSGATAASLLVHNTMAGIGDAIALGVAIGGSPLFVLSIYIIGIARGQQLQAATLEERLHGWKLLREAIARSAGKLFLTTTLWLLYLARYPSIRLFLRTHPLTLYMLVVCAVGILTLNEIGEVAWYRLFYAFLRRRRRIAALLPAVTDGQQLDVLALEEEDKHHG